MLNSTNPLLISPTLFPFSGDDDSSGDEGLGVMGGVEGRQGPKRSRTILTPSQRKVFKESFEVKKEKKSDGPVSATLRSAIVGLNCTYMTVSLSWGTLILCL